MGANFTDERCDEQTSDAISGGGEEKKNINTGILKEELADLCHESRVEQTASQSGHWHAPFKNSVRAICSPLRPLSTRALAAAASTSEAASRLARRSLDTLQSISAADTSGACIILDFRLAHWVTAKWTPGNITNYNFQF